MLSTSTWNKYSIPPLNLQDPHPKIQKITCDPHKTRKVSKSLGTQTHEILCCRHLGAEVSIWTKPSMENRLSSSSTWNNPENREAKLWLSTAFASKIHQLPTWRKIIYNTGFLGEHSHLEVQTNQNSKTNLNHRKPLFNLNYTVQLQLQPFIQPFASPISEFHCHGQCSYLIGLHTTCTTPRSCSTYLCDGMKYGMRMDEGSIGKTWLHTLKYQFFGMLVVTGDCKSTLFDFKQMLIRGMK